MGATGLSIHNSAPDLTELANIKPAHQATETVIAFDSRFL